ncbi:glycosyltransferase family 4 protein [Vibrio sp. 1291-1]|uniref:glycosyltransferase family 4 protein n=1 Tax=Vibrio sp. 1291-1 TaxID=3074551 RepID=UPI00296ACE95|nr:glycosyltransferase family 4 protein [Vibrio sp. 1291-1]MDW3639853.1 glycosyltransferase family 4 protein [Vibrio sp. 1291-1]
MKTVIISYEFPPRIGGAGIVASDIATAFRKFGQNILIITSYNASIYDFCTNRIVRESVNGVEVIRLPVIHKCWFLTFPYSLKLNSHFFESEDIIILNDFGAAFSFSKIKHYSKYRYTLYVHGKESFVVRDKFLQNVVFSFKKRYIDLIHNAKSVVFVSGFIKQSLLELVPEVKDNSKFSVVYNSIDEDYFDRICISEIPKDMRLTINTKYTLVTACRLVKGKGFDRKLEIFKHLKNKLKLDISWVIIGDGEYKSEFSSIVKSFSLDDVHFLGRVERKNLKYYYSQCDLFWMLSAYEEAYPLVYHEAQACGLPVMGLNLGGVPEVITKGYGVVVNNNNDAIDFITEHYEGSCYVEPWKNKNNNLKTLYSKLIQII